MPNLEFSILGLSFRNALECSLVFAGDDDENPTSPSPACLLPNSRIYFHFSNAIFLHRIKLYCKSTIILWFYASCDYTALHTKLVLYVSRVLGWMRESKLLWDRSNIKAFWAFRFFENYSSLLYTTQNVEDAQFI